MDQLTTIYQQMIAEKGAVDELLPWRMQSPKRRLHWVRQSNGQRYMTNSKDVITFLRNENYWCPTSLERRSIRKEAVQKLWHPVLMELKVSLFSTFVILIKPSRP